MAIDTLDFTGMNLLVKSVATSAVGSNSSINATGITAGTTQSQAGATVLPNKEIIEVSTVANSGDGVVLTVLTAGQKIYIFNAGANPMKLYGSGAATLNAVTATTGITVTNAKGVLVVAVTATDLRTVTGA